MKIQKVHIYGFGKWVDEEIIFPEDPLICIYGENETGKSSLQKFILFMLFGFPPRERKKFYPKRSSRMGGKLFIEDPRVGSFVIERMDNLRKGKALCTFEDGKEQDETWLKNYLKGMDQSLYEAIFSYSTKDLADITLMEGEKLGDVLLNIGLTGYSNLYEVEKEIIKQGEGLFRPRGSLPVLNEALNGFAEIEEKLIDMKQEIDTYKPKQDRYNNLSNKLHELQVESKRLQNKREIIERKLHNFQTIYDYFFTLEQLKEYPEELSFPKNGLQRLEEINKQLNPVKSELKILEGNLKTLSEEIEQVAFQLITGEKRQTLEETITLNGDYKETNTTLKKLKAETTAIKNRMAIILAETQLPLTIEQLQDLSLPFYVEQQWKTCKQRLEKVIQDRNAEEEKLQTVQNELEQLKAEQNELRKQLITDKRRRDYESLIEKADRATEQEQRRKQKEQWKEHKLKRQQVQKRILIGSALISIPLLVSGFLMSEIMYYFIGGAIILFGTIQYFFGNQALNQAEQLFYVKEGEDGPPISIEEIERIKTILDKQRNLYENLRFTKTHIQRTKKQENQIRFNLQSIQERERTTDGEIKEQIEKYPFLAQLDVMFWPEVYSHLSRLLENQDQINELTEKIELLNREVQHIKKRVLEVYNELFQKNEKTFSDSLFQQLTEYNHKLNRLTIEQEEKKKAIQNIKENMKNVQAKINFLNEEREKLFHQAEVSTLEQFYRLEEKYTAKMDLIERLDKLRNQLSLIFTEEEIISLNLQKENKETLQSQLSKIKKELNDSYEKIEYYRKEQAHLKALLNRLESSDSYSEMIHLRAFEQEKLQKLAMEWASLQVAEDLLKEAKTTYQRKYLKDLFVQMEYLFNLITEGKYNRIIPPSEKLEFTVQSNKGENFTVEELSQGTIEQLYLSLKLSLGHLISAKHRVPFMIDDAFVHFDAKRLRKMLEIIVHLSQEKQILLFTCKKEVIDQLNKKHIVRLKGDDQ